MLVMQKEAIPQITIFMGAIDHQNMGCLLLSCQHYTFNVR
jgi:hypothetical protein